MRPKKKPNAEQERGLAELRLITMMMREHAEQGARLAERRRKKAIELRTDDVSYPLLAEAMDVSETAVHKLLKGAHGGVVEAREAEGWDKQ